jgi:hypothetical protein
LHICTSGSGFEKDSSNEEGEEDDCYSEVSAEYCEKDDENVENRAVEDLSEEDGEDVHLRDERVKIKAFFEIILYIRKSLIFARESVKICFARL